MYSLTVQRDLVLARIIAGMLNDEIKTERVCAVSVKLEKHGVSWASYRIERG